jgi:hypothetical protein
MIADYFTKTLQGSAFRQFRDQILNIDGAPILIGAALIGAPSLTNGKDHRSVLDDSKNTNMHDWTKVVHKRVRKRLTSLVDDDDRLDGHDGPRRDT